MADRSTTWQMPLPRLGTCLHLVTSCLIWKETRSWACGEELWNHLGADARQRWSRCMRPRKDHGTGSGSSSSDTHNGASCSSRGRYECGVGTIPKFMCLSQARDVNRSCASRSRKVFKEQDRRRQLKKKIRVSLINGYTSFVHPTITIVAFRDQVPSVCVLL